MAIYEGQWHVFQPAPHIGIIVSRFNQEISTALLRGASTTLGRLGIDQEQIDTIWVPGAFEIPGVARRVLARYDGLITLGAVIRGETPHFDYVAGTSAQGVATVSAQGDIPVIFGVLTCNTVEEAQARAGGKAGNKGSDAALALVEMISLYRQFSGA